MNRPPNIYIPIGHGEEEIIGEKPVLPPGCQLVVLAQCKRPIHWEDEQNREHRNIKDFIATHPERIGIFADPVHHRREINEAIGSVCAFYTAGDQYPDIVYKLDLSWTRPTMSLRYSGVVPFTTYISNEAETGFTTKDISTQVYPGGWQQKEVSPKPREIYRYSVFPRPQEFPTEDSTRRQMIEFLLRTKNNDGISPTKKSLEKLTKKALYDLITTTRFYKRVNDVKLSTLMTKMPGVYYHLVCRGDSDTLANHTLRRGLPMRRRGSFVQRRLPGLTKENIFEYIRTQFNRTATGINPPFFYENAADVLGPYDELPENIQAAFTNSRRLLLPSEASAQGGRRTYKQRRSKRKTRRARG